MYNGLTLVSAMNLSTDHLQKGVIATLAGSSRLFETIPMREVNAFTYSYNVLEGNCKDYAEAREIGGNYTKGTPEFVKQTETCFIYGGRAKTDSALVRQANFNDLRAENVGIVAKSTAMIMEEDFLLGSGTAGHMKGLFTRLEEGVAGVTVADEITGVKEKAVDEADLVAELIDNVTGCNLLIMSKATKRKLDKVMYNMGYNYGTNTGAFGTVAETFLS